MAPEVKEGSSTAPQTRWQKFSTFIYDKSSGKFLGRTWLSWVQIIAFYIVFYLFLAAFFAICLLVFLETLDKDVPKYYGKGSIIGNYPGMGYQPWLRGDPESTLIYINRSNSDSFRKYTEQMQSFLSAYKEADGTRDCSNGKGSNSDGHEVSDKSCRFNMSDVLDAINPDGCNQNNAYGFRDGRPCIILTLNRMIHWQPVSYPRDSVPDQVKDRYKTNNIAFDCVGEYGPDNDNIGQRIYIPESGISSIYYPYRKMARYHQPFAMVKFNCLPIGVLVEVECHAYAYNILQDQTDRLGMVHFELLVDDTTNANGTTCAHLAK